MITGRNPIKSAMLQSPAMIKATILPVISWQYRKGTFMARKRSKATETIVKIEAADGEITNEIRNMHKVVVVVKLCLLSTMAAVPKQVNPTSMSATARFKMKYKLADLFFEIIRANTTIARALEAMMSRESTVTMPPNQLTSIVQQNENADSAEEIGLLANTSCILKADGTTKQLKQLKNPGL